MDQPVLMQNSSILTLTTDDNCSGQNGVKTGIWSECVRVAKRRVRQHWWLFQWPKGDKVQYVVGLHENFIGINCQKWRIFQVSKGRYLQDVTCVHQGALIPTKWGGKSQKSDNRGWLHHKTGPRGRYKEGKQKLSSSVLTSSAVTPLPWEPKFHSFAVWHEKLSIRFAHI